LGEVWSLHPWKPHQAHNLLHQNQYGRHMNLSGNDTNATWYQGLKWFLVINQFKLIFFGPGIEKQHNSYAKIFFSFQSYHNSLLELLHMWNLVWRQSIHLTINYVWNIVWRVNNDKHNDRLEHEWCIWQI
jgi:hypothetical protein